MSEFKNKSITTKGLELLSKGLSGEKVEFTRIEMGRGKFEGDIGEADCLVDPKQNLTISKISRKGSQVTLSTSLKMEDIATDFNWTEIGVYARGNDGVEILYLYGYTHNSSYISKDSLNEKLINITLMVSNVSEVTAVIDDSLVYLTAEALVEHNQNQESHTDIRNQLEEVKNSLESIDITWEGVTGKPQHFPSSPHQHSWNDLQNRPTSLPASGGTADEARNCSVVKNRDLCAEVDAMKASLVTSQTFRFVLGQRLQISSNYQVYASGAHSKGGTIQFTKDSSGDPFTSGRWRLVVDDVEIFTDMDGVKLIMGTNDTKFLDKITFKRSYQLYYRASLSNTLAVNTYQWLND